MAAPVTMASQSRHKGDIIWTDRELFLPGADLISTVHPTLNHRLLKTLNIPVMLISNMMRPDKKIVQNKGSKTRNSQTGELLQLKLPEGVSEAKKMQKDHAHLHTSPRQRIEITPENCSL